MLGSDQVSGTYDIQLTFFNAPSRVAAAQGLLYLDGRNSQKYIHQTQADF